MSRQPVFVNRLNERGDLVRVEVTPEGYATPPGRKSPTKESSPPVPPSPPLPPPPPSLLEPVTLSDEEKPATAEQSNKQVESVKENVTRAHTSNSTKLGNSPTTPSSPPPLKLYADSRNIRALEKNPMHGDIMNAAEAFKGRRDASSVTEDENAANEEKSSTGLNKDSNYVTIVTGVRHPVYNADEMRKKKQSNPTVSSDIRWNGPKPFEKRNTYRVVPNSQVSAFIANAQGSLEQQRTEGTTGPSSGNPYKRVEDVPEVETLLELMATHDEKGKLIPDWKRKLMARNYRVKLCSQLQ